MTIDPERQARARQLLEAAIKASGLSVGAYARDILKRDARNVRRWLAGKQHLPPAVMDFLEGQAKG